MPDISVKAVSSEIETTNGNIKLCVDQTLCMSLFLKFKFLFLMNDLNVFFTSSCLFLQTVCLDFILS